MKSLFVLCGSLLLGMWAACSPSPPAATSPTYADEVYENNAITDLEHLSTASKRALARNYDQGPEWYGRFKAMDLGGDFAFEEGVTRRDPSAVIQVNDTFFVYYSRTTGITHGFHTGDPEKKVFPWDKTEVWYATSVDGFDWEERGLAVGRGPTGNYDDRSVFTPEVLVHEGQYILVYQTVK
ncbi:MAG: glycosyl hydrolase, partial [Bacteroidota bacterium]